MVVSLSAAAPTRGEVVSWDFENGNDHGFKLTGLKEGTLPSGGSAWTIGPPNQFDGQAPAVVNGALCEMQDNSDWLAVFAQRECMYLCQACGDRAGDSQSRGWTLFALFPIVPTSYSRKGKHIPTVIPDEKRHIELAIAYHSKVTCMKGAMLCVRT